MNDIVLENFQTTVEQLAYSQMHLAVGLCVINSPILAIWQQRTIILSCSGALDQRAEESVCLDKVDKEQMNLEMVSIECE